MPSNYRCRGCRSYFPTPAFAQVGLSKVCSDECKRLAQTTKTTTSGKPKATPKPTDDIPAATRVAVLRRDKHRCRFCGRIDRLNAHHICYKSEGVDHQAHNLITLCGEHHDLVHSNKRYWKPLCLAYVWYTTVEGRSTYLPQLARLLEPKP